ncbi:MAG: TIGR04255 family protein [Methylococcales symbiont of Iophon sp. n. MRB-2018]|nr:MAG: TIGR04255 family protein [Methylococcales symbiont of Iophon sp. n. MRB-2018]KAF3979254.1 MAG: TIGR04255 family protein [Methylococcales symbiont of Iophon sp. n. MRB-2018]
MIDLPKKIIPCPIKEAVFELRFESSVPEDAIFGIVFNQFKDEFNNTATSLPILEVPSQIRNQDPNLMFAPHYKMDSEFFTMQIGPKAISLVNTKEYKGWECFQERISKTFKKLQKIGIITKINRLALRYINVFPHKNIFDSSSVQVVLENSPLDSSNINLVTEIKNDSISSSVRVISGAQVAMTNEIIHGSVVDIDSSIQNVESKCFLDNLNQVHEEEKRLFYKIIGSKVLKTLTVEY